jgi:microcystin-dependent protein
MALETGTYISDLNSSNPVATDGLAQADDHIRLVKSTIKATLPNITGAITGTQDELNTLDGYTGNTADLNILSGAAAAGVTGTEFNRLNGVTSSIQSQINNISSVPSGVIMMWSGSNSSIPSGFVLCNGSNGTPDLRNRFIVGSGSSYSTGNTGGASSVTLSIAQMPSHNHSASSSVSDPGHSHSFKGATGSSGTGKSSRDSEPQTQQTGSSTTGISVSTSIGYKGGNSSHENRPPYYALAYIMKT